jgi:hypothetical protein
MIQQNDKLNVFEFIENKLGVISNEDTLIFDELGLDGLDADVFINDFAEYYGINMAHFNSESYYSSEKTLVNFFPILLKRMFSKPTKKIIPLSVRHLLIMVEKKEWFDPD